ncbi:zinc ribbon domain-containing protein [Natrinema sp. H-ect4]|uniref:zinc ribbon domain-containing protein n=1 Tax=Natrinema sp. H-ect4 TaxID=3242699 RepID=UPI0035A94F7C
MVSVTCSSCSAEVEDPSSYCPECGDRLDYTLCPNCESALSEDADSCPECGYQLVVTADDVEEGPFRGPETGDVVEAVQSVDDDTQEIIRELLARDPDLFKAYCYFLQLEEPGYGIPEDAPEHLHTLYDLIEDTGLKKSVDRVTREFNEDVDESEEVSEKWVQDQLEELIGYGVLGRYNDREGVKYGSIAKILNDTLPSSSTSLEDVDECVSETGMPRDLVLYRVLKASFSYLNFSHYQRIEEGKEAAEA